MDFPKLIDNKRVSLADTLRKIAGGHRHLSIATGYWDLAGTLEIIDFLAEYESIRLLIGKEPLPNRLQSRFNRTFLLYCDTFRRGELIFV